MRPPKLNALRMFDAAARHLNFRVAAEELYLTQGAVAQQVRPPHLHGRLPGLPRVNALGEKGLLEAVVA